MHVSDRAYTTLKRLQILTGVLPVGLFLLSHLATNARVMAGPDAFDRAAIAINRLPYVRIIEVVAIALPMLVHVALGIALGTTPQAAGDVGGYPRQGWLIAQRVTGFFLVVYILFHVFATRLSPARHEGAVDLFALMSGQLRHPGIFAFHVAGLLAATFHFGNGIAALAGPWGLRLEPHPRARLERAGVFTGIVLALVGLLTLIAFVQPGLRWLAHD